MPCTVSAQNVYDELECYGLSSANLTAGWIERKRDTYIKPWIENKTRLPVDGTKQYLNEYYSGTGATILIFRRRFISSIQKAEIVVNNVTISTINLSSIDIISREGIIKSRRNFEDTAVHPLFPRGINNIKFDYTVTVPAEVQQDICTAVLYLLCEQALGQLAGRTGGGNLSIQAFNRNWGKRGRYTDARNDYARNAHALLSPWFEATTGG